MGSQQHSTKRLHYNAFLIEIKIIKISTTKKSNTVELVITNKVRENISEIL